MASRTLPAPRHLRVVSEADRPSATSRWTMSPRRTIAVLVGSTTILTIVGVVMVLSASYVFSYVEYGSSFLFFKRQAVYAVVGFGALLLTSRMRYTVWQRLATDLKPPLLEQMCRTIPFSQLPAVFDDFMNATVARRVVVDLNG